MVWLMRPNCQHLDNHRRCRIHAAPRWVTFFFPNFRPACILDNPFPPADCEWVCKDQLPHPRPAPPQSSSGVMKASM